ncbi:glycosyl hydrolase [Lewinella sp. LCG006]|uniref:VPS10 domain-containing protein n=1 Tax=Lewinella sp. LCG006 TaxID=3231911 RepID=UPI0034613480
MPTTFKFLALCGLFLWSVSSFAQETTKDQPDFSGLEWRSIGPALMSGRIADIAIHPQDQNVWYVAVGSGGVWKTENAGVTWASIFDGQGAYSIGCVTIDARDPNRVWVGTGENVGGRHMGYGDGIYLSTDGGQSWENKGLKTSEHISKIVVHPDNSNVLWVAAQGPLWSKGGERGIFKSTDGGTTWKRTLGDEEWTGATDLLIDPRNPQVLYAATWQRHRTVAAYMGGGPDSGIHRSTDGGETWEELTNGLPDGPMGKIGLAISPQQPDVLYAAIELNRRTGAVYRSTNRGASWEKRSEAVSGATGPHYYQELYASPHQFDRLYLMDVRVQVSDDGGSNFRQLQEEHKHSDNHALAFRADDPDYLLMGTDGGLYESFDLAKNWRFMANLPLTQFYKIAVDDTEPFYNIYGGTQDNSTQGGPSRTDKVQGIQNSDWSVVLNWDGHQPATEPGNPDIVYAERQEGTLSRIDMTTGEVIDIQPQPAPGENYERFNWDAPILVSPHDPARIYFASQRVWRSDNRGDNWEAISDDLTRNQERFELPIMGSTQSWDNSWDVLAMSNYNTITSLAESPVQEGLLYAGTDDGMLQVTEDGGQNWRKIEWANVKGVPATAFVNDVKADLFAAKTVYVVLDNHKYGDYNPYLLKSTDAGRTWTKLGTDLPERTLLWRIVQDHVNGQLLFLGTEFGVYFSVNGGQQWHALKGGLPTISFRDLAIQRRENDLVGASFGRGLFVLDDYTALRSVSETQLAQAATLFTPRDAWWYIPRSHLGFDEPKGDQGGGHFVAPNPDFGAVFTYYLKEGYTTAKETRQKAEKEADKVTFPGWEAIEKEAMEAAPKVFLLVRNAAGAVIRQVDGPTAGGFHRVAWDLRHASPGAITGNDFGMPGRLAMPGKYTAELYQQVDGKVSSLSAPVTFTVKRLREGALPGATLAEVEAFWQDFEKTFADFTALAAQLEDAGSYGERLTKGLENTPAAANTLRETMATLSQEMHQLKKAIGGDPDKVQVGEKNNPVVFDRIFAVMRGVERSTYGPTAMHRMSLEAANAQIKEIGAALTQWKAAASKLGKDIQAAGGPWVME